MVFCRLEGGEEDGRRARFKLQVLDEEIESDSGGDCGGGCCLELSCERVMGEVRDLGK